MRVKQWAVVAAIVSGVSLIGGGVAAAQPSEPVTITLSPEQVQNLCEKRLPKAEKRIAKLLARINGDAQVKGSVAWLKARAEKERAAGRETSAQVLRERAERRAGRVEQLNKANDRVTQFQSKHCGAK
ncbi:hypothetical protein [Actinokineospora xionganensis]|uniref:Secreted protein n=1 Tax=Actinokineospora xionganensis TaxID=2684470 RepID=A0ABR7L2H5_9PSEU|nr:hypothetical protein [Actinokineospora xionganensis]MBC6446629.1 hypothetical protein [Actinokineospora xionganensis]